MDPIGALIEWIAVYGAIGLIAIGVAERFVPVLPSYGVLVAIGIAAANGAWSVITAVTATVIGSLAACVLLYGLTLALGQVRAYRILDWLVGLAGMPASRKDRLISSFQSRQHLLAFGSQLVPTVRLVSPVIAGVFRADPRAFTIATAAGIIIWNALFISAGHVAAAVAPASNASSLAIGVLILLVVAETTFALAWRWFRRPAIDRKRQ